MLKITTQRQFERDLKLMLKRGRNMTKIKNIITLLEYEKQLPVKNRNHKLQGEYKGCWECHVEPDWLLIYIKTSTDLILVRTGSHSDLFK